MAKENIQQYTCIWIHDFQEKPDSCVCGANKLPNEVMDHKIGGYIACASLLLWGIGARLKRIAIFSFLPS